MEEARSWCFTDLLCVLINAATVRQAVQDASGTMNHVGATSCYAQYLALMSPSRGTSPTATATTGRRRYRRGYVSRSRAALGASFSPPGRAPAASYALQTTTNLLFRECRALSNLSIV